MRCFLGDGVEQLGESKARRAWSLKAIPLSAHMESDRRDTMGRHAVIWSRRKVSGWNVRKSARGNGCIDTKLMRLMGAIPGQ